MLVAINGNALFSHARPTRRKEYAIVFPVGVDFEKCGEISPLSPPIIPCVKGALVLIILLATFLWKSVGLGLTTSPTLRKIFVGFQ